MGSFTFVDDLTSDVMFEARGNTLAELFEEAARAMFSVVCEIDDIDPVESFEIKVEADDEKGLLFEFLGRLLTIAEIKGLFLSVFKVGIEQRGEICVAVAVASGEKISQEKGGTVVKGIAMYGFSFSKTLDGYRARVAMDV